MNGILVDVSVMCLVVLLLIFLLKKLRQPSMIAYILAGVKCFAPADTFSIQRHGRIKPGFSDYS